MTDGLSRRRLLAGFAGVGAAHAADAGPAIATPADIDAWLDLELERLNRVYRAARPGQELRFWVRPIRAG
jgi:hypothetical protein